MKFDCCLLFVDVVCEDVEGENFEESCLLFPFR